jgi:hypothetical protein
LKSMAQNYLFYRNIFLLQYCMQKWLEVLNQFLVLPQNIIRFKSGHR